MSPEQRSEHNAAIEFARAEIFRLMPERVRAGDYYWVETGATRRLRVPNQVDTCGWNTAVLGALFPE
jgi:hypothetical protein